MGSDVSAVDSSGPATSNITKNNGKACSLPICVFKQNVLHACILSLVVGVCKLTPTTVLRGFIAQHGEPQG
jgi:hypothetical protein